MKRSCSLIGLCTLYGYPSTGNTIYVRMCGNDTTNFSVPPSPRPIPWVYIMKYQCVIFIWGQLDNAAIYPPHSSQLTCVPSPITHCLCVSSTCFSQTNLGMHTIAFVLPRFFCRTTLSKIGTSVANVFCTQMGFWPGMQPLSA